MDGEKFEMISDCVRKKEMVWKMARVDLGVMAVKGYSASPRAPALLESHH